MRRNSSCTRKLRSSNGDRAPCVFIEVFLDELVAINLAIEDQAGHRSNVLSALANLEGRRPR
jgi:hypothetical protein